MRYARGLFWCGAAVCGLTLLVTSLSSAAPAAPSLQLASFVLPAPRAMAAPNDSGGHDDPAFPGDMPIARGATEVAGRSSRPRYHTLFDASLLAAGMAGYFLAGRLGTDSSAPAEALDRSDIHLGLDRKVIGETNASAGRASTRLRNISLSFPILLSVISANGGERLSAPLSRAILYAESWSTSEAITVLIKHASSRPRPYLYLPESERPTDPLYDASAEQAYQSFPSGHAAIVWCAVSTAITDHLLTRPNASWAEHAAIGFVGGVFGASVSTLRVHAGLHFPTDVLAGSAIGIASGVMVPLLHRYTAVGERSAGPARHAWLGALGGTVAGVGAGYFAARGFGN